MNSTKLSAVNERDFRSVAFKMMMMKRIYFQLRRKELPAIKSV